MGRGLLGPSLTGRYGHLIEIAYFRAGSNTIEDEFAYLLRINVTIRTDLQRMDSFGVSNLIKLAV